MALIVHRGRTLAAFASSCIPSTEVIYFAPVTEIQLDGAHLDDAYHDMLHEQLKKVFQFFPVSEFPSRQHLCDNVPSSTDC